MRRVQKVSTASPELFAIVGGRFDEIREGRMIVTPDMAERILREANYPRQRKVDHREVGVYAEMMRRGLWEVADPIAFGRVGHRTVLVNGQHRLHAVIAYGREVEFRIAINECATDAELASLYYRFDTVMRRRSSAQVLSAVDLSGSHGVSRTTAAAVYRAVGIIANEFRTPRNHTRSSGSLAKMKIIDLRIEACAPWWEPAQALEASMKRAQTEIKVRLMRATTYAVALMTMRHQPAKAELFWRGVAENDGLKRFDPRHTFVRDLLTRDASSGMHDQGVVAAAIAWNAFFEGRQLKIIKVAQDYGLRIAGTPVGSRRA